MHFLAQSTSVESVISRIIEAAIENPQAGLFLFSLLAFWLGTRAIRDELKQGRAMLNDTQKMFAQTQKDNSEQEGKALDMAIQTIGKIDRFAESLDKVADSQREASINYLTASQKMADAHVSTTNTLVARIAAMDEKRAEDEMYSNAKLMTQVDTALLEHKENVAKLVGTILGEAQLMHEQTREAFVKNTDLLVLALKATPPAENKSASETE